MSQLPSQLQSAAMMQPDKRPFSYLPTGGLSELQKRQVENRAVLDHYAASSSSPASAHVAATRPATISAHPPARPQPHYAPQYGVTYSTSSPAPSPVGSSAAAAGSASFRPVNAGAAYARPPYYATGSTPQSSQPTSGCQSPVFEHYPDASYQDSVRSLSPPAVGGAGGGTLRSKYGSPTFGWSPTPTQPVSPSTSDVVAYVLQPDGSMAAIRCPTTEQAAVLASIQENPGVRRSVGPPRRQVSGGGGKGVSARTQGLSYKMLQALTLTDDGGDKVDGSRRSSLASESREEELAAPPAAAARGIRIITRQSSHDSCHSQKSHDSFTDF